MDNLHDGIESFLKEVMDIRCSKMEHFCLVWEGDFRVPENDAVNYIKRRADSLNLNVIFKKGENGIGLAFMPKPEKRESKKWINALLLMLTFLTTLIAGTYQQGINPFSPVTNLLMGLPFSVSIMLILGSHELGHYITARKNNVDATLPYFLPAPPFLGSFGAVIKMKSPIRDKNSLVAIGSAGPIVGFIFSTIVILIGLSLSKVVTISGDQGITLGDSILIKLLTKLYFPDLSEGKDILLNPIAFAGWIGYFITALNLLPVGQLDGGHILYALVGEKSRIVGYIVFGIAVLLSLFWIGWIVWSVMFWVIGFRHPPTLDRISPLSGKHKVIGIISLIIFILTFVPAPFIFG
jgi:membrane-associated protease RseP (regulator of RpoE activity)